jgi:hypothetical protein
MQPAESGKKSETRGQHGLRLEERPSTSSGLEVGGKRFLRYLNSIFCLKHQTSNAKRGPCALNLLPRFLHDEPLWIHNCIHPGSDSGVDDAGDLLSTERRASRGN